MKLLTTILATYLLLLNFLPCMDEEVRVGILGNMDAFITQADTDTLPDEAVPLPCSPFCYNDGGQVLVPSVVSVFLTGLEVLPREIALKNTFRIANLDLPSRLFALGIFHPPQ